MENVNMILVDSSAINSIGFNGKELFIEFNSGTIYSYVGCTQELFNEFLNADSKGSFFHKKIKDLPNANMTKYYIVKNNTLIRR